MKPTKCPAKEKLMRQQMRKKKAGEKAKENNKDYCVTFDFFKPSLRTQTYSGRGFFQPVACHWAERSDDRKYVCVRRLSQSDSKPRHLKKKIIVLTEDLVKLFITNCKSLIFRILE